MSQQYPPPPGQMPPNYGAPQPGYGVPATRTSGAAIASLICGILGCIPVITSLLAIILGFVGLGATSKPGVTGRGLAIGGLLLGILGVLGWGAFGGTVWWGWQQAKKQIAQSAKPFMDAVVEGDVNKAKQYAALSDEEIQSLHDQIADWGTVQDMKLSGFDVNKSAGQPDRIAMKGTANFSKAGAKEFDVVLDTSTGQLKIVGAHFK